MRRPFIALLACIVAVSVAPAAPADGVEDPFRVDGLPPQRVLATRPWDHADPPRDRPMLGRLDGILGAVSPEGVRALRRGLGRTMAPEDATDAAVIGTLHLSRGDRRRRLDVLDLGNGRRGVRTAGDGDPRVWQIRPDALNAAGVDRWAATWTPQPAEPGARLRIDGAGSACRLTLDTAATRRVFRARFPPLSRTIVDESFHVRVPTNHDRSRPAGVLVWISPTDDGRLPPVLERGVDELGLIAVGAEMAGNTRPLTDRLQLMLDAVETARRRFLIDEERVYVAGMSGGGRCAAMLQCALPEVFAGTVPIVGIDTYHHVPTGHGDARWAARFGKPPPPVFHLLKSRRIAPITGDLDFNDTETRARAGLLAEDGLTVRVEIVPGMGHTLPPPDTFARVLSWVDQPRRDAIAAAEAEAARLLAAVPSGPPTDHATHAALEAVAAAAPWSAPAWEAAERLGYSRAAFLTGER